MQSTNSLTSNTIHLPLCDWFYFAPLCPEVEAARHEERAVMFRRMGYDVRPEYNGVGFWRRYLVYFATEDDAALFKLTHL